MPPRSEITLGSVFGRLRIIGEAAPVVYAGCKRRRALAQCSCGAPPKAIFLRSLVIGATRSCGCLNEECRAARRTKHGAARIGLATPEYVAWRSMIDRCAARAGSKHLAYRRLGIEVCSAWRESFEEFLAYVGPRPSPAHSLDRHPNTRGNYEPGNVRWATRVEQARNTTRNTLLTNNGTTATIAEWAERTGISHRTLQGRHASGWPDAETLTRPVGRWPRRTMAREDVALLPFPTREARPLPTGAP